MRPILPLALLGVLLAAGFATAQTPSAALPPATEVHAGIYLINFGNFDVTKGTYTMDFYLWFRWDPARAPGNFSPEKFEFMNGRPASKDKIIDQANPDGTREVWWRIQANLYTDPDFRSYPFDQQRLSLQFEDSVSPITNLTYAPLTNESGVDPGVRVAGYRLDSSTMRTEEKAYPFGERYSRGIFEVVVTREPFGTTVKTLLPPLVFMLVSGLSFLFPPEKLALRVGAGTSMLISAVMYHISQTSSLPPLGTLTLIDKIMMSTYAFLTLSLAITAMISVNADYWKKPALTAKLTRYGALVTLAAPLIAFAFLFRL